MHDQAAGQKARSSEEKGFCLDEGFFPGAQLVRVTSEDVLQTF
jgi:hypothetical protein